MTILSFLLNTLHRLKRRTLAKKYMAALLETLKRYFLHISTSKYYPHLVNLIPYVPHLSLCFFAWYGHGISTFFSSAVFVVFLLLVVAELLYLGQDYLLYYPNQPGDSRHLVFSPSRFGLNHESITITTGDGTNIHAFLLKAGLDYSSKPVIILLHGNAGNIGHRLPYAVHLINECDVNVVMMEYRGYGLSGGEISEEGFYDDAMSTVRYIRNRNDLNSKRIILHGSSLGGAVAICVASQPEFSSISALMLENTFTSLPDIAQCVLRFSLTKMLPIWCYKNRYPSIERISSVSLPILFLSGRADTLVPPKHMDRLYMASGAIRKEFSSFLKGTHNETWTEPGYFFSISNFIRQNVS